MTRHEVSGARISLKSTPFGSAWALRQLAVFNQVCVCIEDPRTGLLIVEFSQRTKILVREDSSFMYNVGKENTICRYVITFDHL